MKIIVTGACGFLGHHVVEHFLKNTDWDIVGVDAMTYASMGYDRLRDVDAYDDKRVTLVGWDISEPASDGVIRELKGADYLLHLAAETHVDRSIVDTKPFIKANVMGTENVIELLRDHLPTVKLMVNFSTDEVFGPAPKGVYYREWDRFRPTNGYAVTKAAAVMLGERAHHVNKLPICTTFTMNIFGERQHPEKFIPLCINKILAGETIKIHGNADRTEPGSRCWIHARNVAAALHWLLGNALPGQRYNIVGEEFTNLSIAALVAATVDEPLKAEIVDFHSERPGHDLRYALDGSRLRGLGWEYPKSLGDSLAQTVLWSVAHPKWLVK